MSEEEALGLSVVFLIATVLAYLKGYSSGYAAGTIDRR
jgi:hypothetical protein